MSDGSILLFQFCSNILPRVIDIALYFGYNIDISQKSRVLFLDKKRKSIKEQSKRSAGINFVSQLLTNNSIAISLRGQKHNPWGNKVQRVLQRNPFFFWASIPYLCRVGHCTKYEGLLYMISCSIALHFASCIHPIYVYLPPFL